MRLIKRLAGWMGFGNHEVNKDPEDETDVDGHDNQNSVEDINHYIDGSLPRKGFSVPARVHVDKARQIAPILVPCPAADGAVQVTPLIFSKTSYLPGLLLLVHTVS